MKDVIEALDEFEDKTNLVVAAVESLRSLEKEAQAIKAESEGVKKRFDDGDISKFSYLKIVDSSKQRLSKAIETKKDKWSEIVSLVNELTDILTEIKDAYNIRIDSDGLGKIEEEK
ncbi:MAG: hypothetical protein ABH821_00615 [archaeon]